MKYNITTLTKIGVTLQVIKTALAAGISWGLALWIPGSTWPIFAPLAAILTIQLTIADSIKKGMYRILGVIFGVSVGGFIGHFFVISAISIGVAIFLGMSVTTAFRLNSQIISQVGVSALLVLGFWHTDGYMLGRVVETIIGALVAVAVNMSIHPPKSSMATKQMIYQLTQEMADTLAGLGNKTEGGLFAGLLRARQLVQQTVKNYEDVILIIQNFRYTPFQRQERAEMKRLVFIMNQIECMAPQIRGIARSLLDLERNYNQSFDLTSALEQTAKCIKLFSELNENPSFANYKALENMILETRAIQTQFFVEFQQQAKETPIPEIGGVFTDLGRILDELENRFPVEEHQHDLENNWLPKAEYAK